MLEEELSSVSAIEADFVPDGLAALKALEHSDYDLILMDINMPILSGNDAMKSIRDPLSPFSSIPIVVVSSSALYQEQSKYLDVGADAFLPKPVMFDDLHKIIDQYAERKRLAS